MNDRDAAELLEMRQAIWPHAKLGADPDVAISVWSTVLGAFTIDQARSALLSMRHRPYAPGPGEVEQAINPLPLVSFEGWLADAQRLNHKPGGIRSATQSDWSHSTYASFAVDHGEVWCLMPDPAWDAQAAATVRSQLRDLFKAHNDRRDHEIRISQIAAPARDAIGQVADRIGIPHGDES